MNDKIIKAAIEYIDSVFNGNSDGHDMDHSMRVYRNAMSIAEGYPGSGLFAGFLKDNNIKVLDVADL